MPTTRKAKVWYPISEMDMGDSFFVPALDVEVPRRQIHKLAVELSIKVSCISGIDTATGLFGLRVLRVG